MEGGAERGREAEDVPGVPNETAETTITKDDDDDEGEEEEEEDGTEKETGAFRAIPPQMKFCSRRHLLSATKFSVKIIPLPMKSIS